MNDKQIANLITFRITDVRDDYVEITKQEINEKGGELTYKNIVYIEEYKPYLRFLYLLQETVAMLYSLPTVKEYNFLELSPEILCALEKSYYEKYSERLTCARYFKRDRNDAHAWVFSKSLGGMLSKLSENETYANDYFTDEQLKFIENELKERKKVINFCIGHWNLSDIYSQKVCVTDRDDEDVEYLL